MKGVWGQLRVPYFVMSKFSNSAQVLDLSNSCLVHHFPLSTMRMSKNKTIAMHPACWRNSGGLFSSAKSEYQSINVLDILCSGCPSSICSLRFCLSRSCNMVRPQRCLSPPLNNVDSYLRIKNLGK